ncbi:MAG: hypothetical protein ACLTFJ_11860 [Clostridium sp.]
MALDTKAYVYSHPKMYQTVEGQYYSVLAYPIYLRDYLEGVLVIASFDKTQHQIIMEKQEQLMVYLEKSQVLSPVSWNGNSLGRPISSTTRWFRHRGDGRRNHPVFSGESNSATCTRRNISTLMIRR